MCAVIGRRVGIPDIPILVNKSSWLRFKGCGDILSVVFGLVGQGKGCADALWCSGMSAVEVAGLERKVSLKTSSKTRILSSCWWFWLSQEEVS